MRLDDLIATAERLLTMGHLNHTMTRHDFARLADLGAYRA